MPYSTDITLPKKNAEELFAHALQMSKFEIEKDNMGEIIILPREQAVLMTYYRNNIHHLLALPSLLASIVMHHDGVSRKELLCQIHYLYPLLKNELFMHFDDESLKPYLKSLIDEFLRQELILEHEEKGLVYNPKRIRHLQLLSAGMRDTLQRYSITLSLLLNNPEISRGQLEKESRLVAQRLSVLHGINSPEFFDKAVFASLISTLRDIGYVSEDKEESAKILNTVYKILSDLITPEVRLTIESVALESD